MLRCCLISSSHPQSHTRNAVILFDLLLGSFCFSSSPSLHFTNAFSRLLFLYSLLASIFFFTRNCSKEAEKGDMKGADLWYLNSYTQGFLSALCLSPLMWMCRPMTSISFSSRQISPHIAALRLLKLIERSVVMFIV